MTAAAVDVFNVNDTASLQLAAEKCSKLAIGSSAVVNLAPGTYLVRQPILFQGPGSLSIQSDNSLSPAQIQCAPDITGSALQVSANSSLVLHGISFLGCSSTAMQVDMVADGPSTVEISSCSFINCTGQSAGALGISVSLSVTSAAASNVTLTGCTFESSNVVPPTDPTSGISDSTGHAAVITAGPGVSLGVTVSGNSSFLNNGDLTEAGGSGTTVLYVGCGGTSLDPQVVDAPSCSLSLSDSVWASNSAITSSGALLSCSGAPNCTMDVERCTFDYNRHSFMDFDLGIKVEEVFKVRASTHFIYGSICLPLFSRTGIEIHPSYALGPSHISYHYDLFVSIHTCREWS